MNAIFFKNKYTKHLWHVFEQVVQSACLPAPLFVFFLFSAFVAVAMTLRFMAPSQLTCSHAHGRWHGGTKTFPWAGVFQ